MAKKLTTDLRHVDIRRLERDGYLMPGNDITWGWTGSSGKTVASIGLAVGIGSVTFRYSIGESRHQVDQTATLTKTACHFGGARSWFLCPCCGRRVAKLYIGRDVACRRCYGMAYKVQRESKADRDIRRLNAIRLRLGWQPGFLNGKEWKPDGMHWKTYRRLEAEHDRLADAAMGAFYEILDRTENRLRQAMQV